MAPQVDVQAIDARSQVAHTRRPGRAVIAGLCVLAGVFILATRMVPHPVGAARSSGKFQGKAVTTARSALSEVNTSALIARTYNDGGAFGPYAGLVAGDAEDAVGGLQSTFDSIQPPNPASDDLADELNAILTDAADHARSVRIAIRRSASIDETDLRGLAHDANKLDDFIDKHS